MASGEGLQQGGGGKRFVEQVAARMAETGRHKLFETSKVSTDEDKDAAQALVVRKYQGKGLLDKSGENAIAKKLNPETTVTFVAKRGEKVVGTLSMAFGDSLPMEKLFPEVGELRESNKKVVEVCQFATDSSISGIKALPLPLALFQRVLEACQTDKIDHLVIEVNPDQESFYINDLKFTYLGGERIERKNPELNNAPAVALTIEPPNFPGFHSQTEQEGLQMQG